MWGMSPSSAALSLLQEAYRLQWRCFLGLVYEQRHLPNLKALLKLYSSISLPKLASLLEGTDEAAVRGQLILLKVRFAGAPGLHNEAVSWAFKPVLWAIFRCVP